MTYILILIAAIVLIPIFIGLYKWDLAHEYMLVQHLHEWDEIEDLFVQFNFKTSRYFPNPYELFKSGIKWKILFQHWMSVIPINAKEIPDINLNTVYPSEKHSFDEVFENAHGIIKQKDIRETHTNC